ncbi:MAG TPA: copper homeostasis protein CutC, partial [Roseiarcus sp.]|nr:copper homeostasis protein CutC [Roseiarcus sp.]
DKRSAELIAAARPLAVTFHRAFDVSRDPFLSLDALIRLKVDRLLTSGQAPSVIEGAPLIRELIARAAGRIIIMPAATSRRVTPLASRPRLARMNSISRLLETSRAACAGAMTRSSWAGRCVRPNMTAL